MSDPCIPIPSRIIGEFYLRRGPSADISGWIENVLEDYLERTEDDEGWNEEYYDYISVRKWGRAELDEFGDPGRGYHWTPIFLPNGSEISMEYKREKYVAVVKHEKIHYKDKTYTPSEFARIVANNTSRNAWRDLYVRRPGEARWVLADQLRRPQS